MGKCPFKELVRARRVGQRRTLSGVKRYYYEIVDENGSVIVAPLGLLTPTTSAWLRDAINAAIEKERL